MTFFFKDASVKCYPTYVRYLPTGEETGRFLALDLGGTNFRVLLVEIGEEKAFSMESRVFAIPRKVMLGTGEELFDHIATCLHEFVVEYGLQEVALPLGFTFSFPCKQEGLAKVNFFRLKRRRYIYFSLLPNASILVMRKKGIGKKKSSKRKGRVFPVPSFFVLIYGFHRPASEDCPHILCHTRAHRTEDSRPFSSPFPPFSFGESRTWAN